jgi:glycosyltransferase involved in cell wall biosynthesis
MSNALLEAMASGLPCVATRVGAAEEMIVHGVTGLLVDVGDQEALRASIVELAADRGLCERLGQEASQRVAARFTIGRVVDRIIQSLDGADGGESSR